HTHTHTHTHTQPRVDLIQTLYGNTHTHTHTHTRQAQPCLSSQPTHTLHPHTPHLPVDTQHPPCMCVCVECVCMINMVDPVINTGLLTESRHSETAPDD